MIPQTVTEVAIQEPADERVVRCHQIQDLAQLKDSAIVLTPRNRPKERHAKSVWGTDGLSIEATVALVHAID